MEGTSSAPPGRFSRVRAWCRSHPAAVTLIGFTIVVAALVIGLWDKRDDFTAALGSASLLVLGGAVLLQVVWLIARSEAWNVCVDAAGGSVGRRRLYRAASVGYLANVFNSNVGVAVRIAALRRSAPRESPSPTVLVAAEMPILVVEGVLCAVMSFTLIGPLGMPWWVPVICLAVAAALVWGGARLIRNRREGFWRGLDVMRGLKGRNAIIALVVLAVSMQVVRNWLVLEGIGVDISILDAVALLIAAAAVGLLPVGPSLGAATAVLILGGNGVAAVAAAGALLTATGVVGTLFFAAWALVDRLRPFPAPAAAAAP